MKTKDLLFADYDGYHRNPFNKTCHFIGIPLIVGSLLGLALRWDFVTVGRVGLVGTLGRTLPPAWAAGAFVLGWIFQFVGHLGYEKKSPAFLKNAGHLLIGPLWVLEAAMGRRS